MNKKKDKVLSTALGATIVIVCCTVGLGYRSKNISESGVGIHKTQINKNKALIVESIKDLSGKSKDDVIEKLGEPKEIYQESVYTYIDSLGKYDLLIHDKVENVVLTLNDGSLVNYKIMLDNLGVDFDKVNLEKVTKEGKETATLYDNGQYKKIYMVCRPNSEMLEYVKIEIK